MNTCQNCGKLSNPESIFCRFCGTKFNFRAPQPPSPFEHAAPRPYSWKTDEFQAGSGPKNTVPIDRVPGVTSAFTPANAANRPAPLASYQPEYMSRPFRCPHCMSTYLPRIERRISTGGWITFAVLLVFFFPLFWIGLLIKEDVQVCQSCNTKVG